MTQGYQPIKAQLTAQNAEVDLCKNSAKEAVQKCQRIEKTLREKSNKMNELRDTLEQPKQELENAKQEEAARQNKIDTWRREIDVKYIICMLCFFCMCVMSVCFFLFDLFWGEGIR